MIQFVSRMPRRLVAIAVSLMAILSFTVLSGGVAYASAQANQEWFGLQNPTTGFGYYLGWPSGEWYSGYISTFNGSDSCIGDFGFGSNLSSGQQVELTDCAGGSVRSQTWNQFDNHDGSWTYMMSSSVGQHFCMDSLMGHHYNGSPVEFYPCNFDNAQRWTIGPQGQLQSVDSPGYCLDDTNWSTTPGTGMQLWWCAYD